ncbi:DUF1799 domain-containing protein [Cereibacter azotoformans]|uniref:Uncharacterized protein DUF1799 n=1 Tax=Cereibacter azotoformans TaxID=43057 RepID=A0A2T5JSD5_9RHOB|nr:DUF1799 domain-containing protein [Cereibacter azotoformans]MBO4168869.1 DUF1799 domain-containing protein [Cereibacter azotoformans]PTR11145.1 uncharacterized protein DUF1799 [Cereibacter azotoformans]
MADARRWGMDLEDALDRDDQGVWPEHAAAVAAFLAISTQWRWVGSGMGGVMAIGLDYAGARAGLALAGIEVTADLWHAITLIEAGALAALNGGGP